MRRLLPLLLLLALAYGAGAQRLIEYTSGMGSRAPGNADVWILYSGVTMSHDGMRLEADSAHYDTRQNSFTAFGDIFITLTDTTFIYGNQLYYDGTTRVLDIWDDTVVLVDGSMVLRANHLTYERDRATAYYTLWGYAVNDERHLYSRQGQYNSDLKEFYIYNDVRLEDSTMLLLTDTLVYYTTTSVAHFESPTTIYTDSAVVHSELGDYNTETRYAISYRHSSVEGQGQSISSDTLLYDEQQDYGRAFGNVRIVDTANQLTCTGRRGETNQAQHYSFVTDSALVVYEADSLPLYIHADTVYAVNDSARQLQYIRACHGVKAYREDSQAMCDSLFYDAVDSVLSLFYDPVLWYDSYQLTADTLEMHHDSAGISRAYMRSKCFALQQVDRERFNQIKGKQGVVYFDEGELRYADIVGNAQSVFYITEESEVDGHTQLVGVNAGVGSSMRIYFDSTKAASRVVTYDQPDMQTYPVDKLPDEWQRLADFRWLSELRPRTPYEVFPPEIRPAEPKKSEALMPLVLPQGELGVPALPALPALPGRDLPRREAR